MIEEAVAPLDAYATAKPDEPTFTLQGGDPLGAPLVRLWSILARLRAGVFQPASLKMWLDGVVEVANNHRTGEDERERDSLLVRATAAEEVSWTMDDYAQGRHAEALVLEVLTEVEQKPLEEIARLDLHDLRIKVAQRLSNFSSELVEMTDKLGDRDFDADVLTHMSALADGLKILSDQIEPRRMMKKEAAHG